MIQVFFNNIFRSAINPIHDVSNKLKGRWSLPRRSADLRLKIVQTTIYSCFVLYGHYELTNCEVDPELVKIKTEKQKQDQLTNTI